MRIISQPGLVYKDIPYEKYGLTIVVDESDDREPFFNIQTIEGNYMMAVYSTYELAEKALVFIHHNYIKSVRLIDNQYVPINRAIKFPKESVLQKQEVYSHED